jgi:hypothetical protein
MHGIRGGQVESSLLSGKTASDTGVIWDLLGRSCEGYWLAFRGT